MKLQLMFTKQSDARRSRPESRALGCRSERRGERGAALLEAAIVLPLLLILVAGILEFGVGFQESATIAAAARAGARSASALPKNATFAQAAADAATAQLQGVPSNAPQALWVFHVAPNTAGPIGRFGNCTDCQGFRWDPNQKRFDTSSNLPGSNAWLPANQVACGAQSDDVGVAVLLNHKYFFGMFGTSKMLSRASIMRLEPFVGSTACGG